MDDQLECYRREVRAAVGSGQATMLHFRTLAELSERAGKSAGVVRLARIAENLFAEPQAPHADVSAVDRLVHLRAAQAAADRAINQSGAWANSLVEGVHIPRVPRTEDLRVLSVKPSEHNPEVWVISYGDRSGRGLYEQYFDLAALKTGPAHRHESTERTIVSGRRTWTFYERGRMDDRRTLVDPVSRERFGVDWPESALAERLSDERFLVWLPRFDSASVRKVSLVDALTGEVVKESLLEDPGTQPPEELVELKAFPQSAYIRRQNGNVFLFALEDGRELCEFTEVFGVTDDVIVGTRKGQTTPERVSTRTGGVLGAAPSPIHHFPSYAVRPKSPWYVSARGLYNIDTDQHVGRPVAEGQKIALPTQSDPLMIKRTARGIQILDSQSGRPVGRRYSGYFAPFQPSRPSIVLRTSTKSPSQIPVIRERDSSQRVNWLTGRPYGEPYDPQQVTYQENDLWRLAWSQRTAGGNPSIKTGFQLRDYWTGEPRGPSYSEYTLSQVSPRGRWIVLEKNDPETGFYLMVLDATSGEARLGPVSYYPNEDLKISFLGGAEEKIAYPAQRGLEMSVEMGFRVTSLQDVTQSVFISGVERVEALPDLSRYWLFYTAEGEAVPRMIQVAALSEQYPQMPILAQYALPPEHVLVIDSQPSVWFYLRLGDVGRLINRATGKVIHESKNPLVQLPNGGVAFDTPQGLQIFDFSPTQPSATSQPEAPAR